MVRRSAFAGEDIFEGAGSFVTVPAGVDPARLSGVVMLPAKVNMFASVAGACPTTPLACRGCCPG